MIDRDFKQNEREIKQSHERYLTAILACDTFKELEQSE